MNSLPVSFSWILSTCPRKNRVKSEMALILEKWLFLICVMPFRKKKNPQSSHGTKYEAEKMKAHLKGGWWEEEIIVLKLR